MRTLECGCELSPLGTIVSLCPTHGEHMRAVATINKLPRNEGIDRELQRDLVKIMAPVVLSRWNVMTDPSTTAECVFQHVKEIMRRLD